MNRLYQLILILQLLFVSLPAFSQYGASNIFSFSTEQGLTQSNVNTILKDRDGFIWLGTDDGLNRFDSHQFKIYRHDASDSLSLSGNEVISLLEDTQGRLWVGTAHGDALNLLDRNTSHFKKFLNKNEDGSSIAQNSALCIAEDSEQNIWVGTHNGIRLLKAGESEFEAVQVTLNRNLHVNAVAFGDGAVWMGTESGLFKYHIETDELAAVSIAGSNNTETNKNIRALLLDHNNYLWIGTFKGLVRMDLQNGTIKVIENHPQLDNSVILSLYKDDSGNIWIGTDGNGIVVYDTKAGEFYPFAHNYQEMRYVSTQKLILDETNVFVATVQNGLKILRHKKMPFEHFVDFHPKIIETGKNAILDFLKDKEGNIWIGTDGAGLYKYSPKIGTFTGFHQGPNLSNSLTSNVIKSLMIDDHENVYVGTYAGGLNIYDTKNQAWKVFRHDPADPLSISNDNVWSLFLDSRGIIWAGTLLGLNTFDPETGQFTHYPSKLSDTTTISSSVVFQIYEDRQNRLWFLTPDGLNEFLYEENRFKRFVPDPNTTSKNFVKEMVEDKNGDFWITSKNVLYKFDGKTFEEAAFMNSLEASPNSIIVDRQNNLWIGTSNGLMRIEYNSWNTQVFRVGAGLQGQHFKEGASLIDDTGNLYMGGINGFNFFNPSDINFENPKIDVALTDFYLFHKKVEPGKNHLNLGDINYTNQIELRHNENDFSIDYAAMDHNYPGANQYAYILEGQDKDWNYVESQRQATYTNVAPGDYTFKVRATGKNGRISTHIRTLNIHIESPFWDTILFKVILSLSLIGLTYGLYKFRISSIERKKEALTKIVNEQTAELRTEIATRLQTEIELNDTLRKLETTQTQLIQSEKLAAIGTLTAGIAHEINNPLNYIQGGIQILKQLKETEGIQSDEELIKSIEIIENVLVNGVDRSSKIVKNLMLYSYNGSAGQNEKQEVNLLEIVNTVSSYLQHKLTNEVTLELKIEDPFPIQVFSDKFSQILINLLNNAIDATIESEKKLITLIAKREEQSFQIIIRNTGATIPPKSKNQIFDPFFTTKDPGKGTGLGLWITHIHVNEHDGTIAQNNTEEGVEFVVTLPQ